jgi:phosphate-selective porin OprO/OprP
MMHSIFCAFLAIFLVSTASTALAKESSASKESQAIYWDGDSKSIQFPGLGSSLTLGALVHLDTRHYVSDDNDKENDVLFRRFRTGAKLDMPDGWSARAVVEWAENTDPFFTDATLDKDFGDDLKLKVGKFKTPLNFERLISGTDMYFMERGYPDQLVASRDIGVQVSNRLLDRSVEWQLALLQGTPDGSSTEQNDDAHYELAGRVYTFPWYSQPDHFMRGFGFGLGASAGERDADVAAPQLTEGYRTPSQITFFEYYAGAYADGGWWRLLPQMSYRYKQFAMIGEWTLSNQSVSFGGSHAQLLHQAWQLSSTYVLTGEYAGLRGGVVPQQSIFDGGIGAWEVAARIGGMVMDKDSFPTFANPADSAESVIGTGLGLNWYPDPSLRVMLNYEYSDFEGGAPLGQDKPDAHAVFARIQFEY